MPWLYPLEEGEARPFGGALAGDCPLAWSSDGRSVFVRGEGEVPLPVFRVDLESGAREAWRELVPGDRAGVVGVGPVVLTVDARAYAYSYRRVVASDLYVADGIE
jgi:hypothetical protein